ncbi:hypothetical protein C0995_005625 [Termitomyces sp. Mi166|nr:hypothetical protein C0995_005625 [Termitomyces sp. Mi166\
MSGKSTMFAGIYLNQEVISDLEWLLKTISKAIGVHFMDTTYWENSSADMVIWTNASLKLGMAFVYAENGFAYQIKPNNTMAKIDIFFLKLLTVWIQLQYSTH